MQSRTLQHRTAAYWPQFKGLKDRLTSYGVFVGNKMSSMGVDVDVGMVDDQPKARAASDRFVQESVDLIVCYVTTYSTSSQVLPAVQQVGRPVLVLNLQPTAQLDYAQTGTGEWLANCQACCIPEISNAFARCAVDFHVVTGLLGLSQQPEGALPTKSPTSTRRPSRRGEKSKTGSAPSAQNRR